MAALMLSVSEVLDNTKKEPNFDKHSQQNPTLEGREAALSPEVFWIFLGYHQPRVAGVVA